MKNWVYLTDGIPHTLFLFLLPVPVVVLALSVAGGVGAIVAIVVVIIDSVAVVIVMVLIVMKFEHRSGKKYCEVHVTTRGAQQSTDPVCYFLLWRTADF